MSQYGMVSGLYNLIPIFIAIHTSSDVTSYSLWLTLMYPSGIHCMLINNVVIMCHEFVMTHYEGGLLNVALFYLFRLIVIVFALH